MRGRVLVTGAGGFIGRWSVPALLARGYEVHAVTGRQPSSSPPRELEGASIHALDLLEPGGVDAFVAELCPTHLLHFAWIATPGVYWTSPDNERWLQASRQLLHAFQSNGGRRAVMAGTCAEYDWSRAGVCDERSSMLADLGSSATTAYAAAKIAMQRSLASVGATQHLSTAWGRIFFQYGPGEHKARLVASVIESLLSGREALCSHGTQVRSFLHVADVGAAFAALLDSAVDGAVNIGSGERTALSSLLNEIARQIGRPELLRLGARAAPAGEPQLLVPDIRRLTMEVGWRPQFALHEGLAHTITWWRGVLAEQGVALRGAP